MILGARRRLCRRVEGSKKGMNLWNEAANGGEFGLDLVGRCGHEKGTIVGDEDDGGAGGQAIRRHFGEVRKRKKRRRRKGHTGSSVVFHDCAGMDDDEGGEMSACSEESTEEGEGGIAARPVNGRRVVEPLDLH